MSSANTGSTCPGPDGPTASSTATNRLATHPWPPTVEVGSWAWMNTTSASPPRSRFVTSSVRPRRTAGVSCPLPLQSPMNSSSFVRPCVEVTSAAPSLKVFNRWQVLPGWIPRVSLPLRVQSPTNTWSSARSYAKASSAWLPRRASTGSSACLGRRFRRLERLGWRVPELPLSSMTAGVMGDGRSLGLRHR